MMECEIPGCPNPADRRVTYAHPDPSLRWSACMCRDHAHEVKPGTGELIYSRIEVPHGQQDPD